MTPSWVNDAVRAFGRQMGLKAFELNDAGLAAVTFENGISLRFEYASEALVVSSAIELPPREDVMKRLLTAVHPAARTRMPLRAAYLAKAGRALYAVRLADREVNVTALEAAFRDLWSAAANLRRYAS